MRTFTTTDDIKNYVHEALSTSEGYPEAYKIDEIADALHELAGWDSEKQAFTENWGDDAFWSIVQENTYYNLKTLKWEDAPIEWGIPYGEVAYIDPDDEDRDADLIGADLIGADLIDADLILEFHPNNKEAVLSAKAELSGLEVHDWVSSSDPQDWAVLDDLFGREQWQTWLAEQTNIVYYLESFAR